MKCSDSAYFLYTRTEIYYSEYMGKEQVINLYQLVGMALSRWEGAQSQLISLFELLCEVSVVDAHAKGNGKLLRDTFIIAPRDVKYKMIAEAVEEHKLNHPQLDRKIIISSIKRYNKLATKRNEIAHGVVTTAKYSENGRVIIDGTFLMPATRAGIRINPTPKYHLTEENIADFIHDVNTVGEIIGQQMKLLRNRNFIH